MKPRTRWIVAATVILIALAGFGLRSLRGSTTGIPTARVERGDLELTINTEGELRTPRSSALVAPPVHGSLQIIRLTPTGTAVKPGDVIIEFDPSEQQFNLEQARYQLLQAEQEIVKLKAEAAVKAAEDKVALLKAQFDVRRAELEVQRNELVSEIDARKNLLNLEEARRRLQQLQEDLKSREQSNRAALAVKEEKRNEARIAIQQAEHSMESMVMRAPIEGIVSLRENEDASGGMFYTGMTLPEFKEGDQVSPGNTIAEIFDTRAMEVQAKIEESDRANIEAGQMIEVALDARPQAKLTGKVKDVAGMAGRTRWSAEAVRRFDVTFELHDPDPGLRVAETANVTVRGKEAKGVLLLPRQAVFERDGKPTVFVKKGRGFEAQEVKVLHRTETRVAVENLQEGTEVALVDPKGPGKTAAPASAAPVVGGGR